MGCIVRVAESISRLGLSDQEEKFIETLTRSLHIPEDPEKTEKSFCKLVLSMMTHDIFYKVELIPSGEPDHSLKNDAINYHGACLLKSCLSFKKCQMIAKSFLSLNKEELTTVACHPSGNHVFESFLSNTNIKKKMKNSLSDMFRGKFAVLASDKFGSRVIDALWKNVGQESKDFIKTELTQNKSKLESDLYGRIVLCNCEINQQARKIREIKEKQDKKRKMFEDILPASKKEEKPVAVKDEEQPPAKKAKGKNKSK